MGRISTSWGPKCCKNEGKTGVFTLLHFREGLRRREHGREGGTPAGMLYLREVVAKYQLNHLYVVM